ncbi:MAG TPA: flagellar hook-length control protein FliK [Acetobacteraceae bacterium]|nr:flagellar hook-length control protein FliK [Acetobacteraceae bacterium]
MTKGAAPRQAKAADTQAAKTLTQDHDPAGHGDTAVEEEQRKPGPRHSGVYDASGGTAPEAKAASAPAGTAAGSGAPAAAPVPAGAAAAGASATSSPVPLAAASGALASLGQTGGVPTPAAGRDGRTRLVSVQAAAGLAALPGPPAPPSAAAASAGAAPSGAGTATAAQAGQPGLQRAAADLAGMGGGSISVTLRPPTLGAVQVQMAVGATGAAHIQLTAATHEGYTALAAAGPALVQHLAGAGIAVGSLRTAMQSGSGHGQPGQEQPRGNGAPRETSRTEDEGEDRILGYA